MEMSGTEENAKSSEIPLESQPDPYEEQIRQRAYEICVERGGQHGSDVQDWLQAETEILSEKKGVEIEAK